MTPQERAKATIAAAVAERDLEWREAVATYVAAIRPGVTPCWAPGSACCGARECAPLRALMGVQPWP